MFSYIILLAVHIISVIIWFGMIPAHLILKKSFTANKQKAGEKKLISAWLKILNLTGMIGMTGVLVSGISLVMTIPYYHFFQFNANHWLTSKQIIMVILVVITGIYFIPIGKKVRIALEGDLESNNTLTEDAYKNIKKLADLASFMVVLLCLNLLFALSRRLMM